MKVGQKVYLNGNGTVTGIQEYEIKSIGRKYFYIWRDNSDRTIKKYSIESLGEVNDFRPADIHFDRQKLSDSLEYRLLSDELERVFNWRNIGNLTLDQLRQIKRIIDEGEEVECQS